MKIPVIFLMGGGKVGGTAMATLAAKATSQSSAYTRAVGGSNLDGTMSSATASWIAIATASGGTATATSEATGSSAVSSTKTSGQGAARLLSTALATGSNGSATAESSAGSGSRAIVGTAAAAVAGGQTQAVAQATFSASTAWALPQLGAGTNGQQAFVLANGAPGKAQVDAQLAANAEVASAFSGGSTVLGIGAMGANYAATRGSRTYTATVHYSFSLASNTVLMLGLLDFTAYGGGFNLLTLTATRKDTSTIFSKTFSALADAQGYFDDQAISLGSFVSGTQGVTLSYSLTASGVKGADFSHLLWAAGPLPAVSAGSPSLKHPNADKLSLTKVDIGTGSLLQIVCVAPNVAAGQTVLVATIGSTLHTAKGEKLEIKKGKIRGEISEGMICAGDELSISDEHSGIIILEDKWPAGTTAAEVYPVYRDTIFEVDLTPNRSDATCHIGVAKDLAAYLTIHKGMHYRFHSSIEEDVYIEQKDKTIKVQIEDNMACPRYSGISITGVTIGPSALQLQLPLSRVWLESMRWRDRRA